jgi:Ca2+-binding RTX toxin-like protein
VLKRLIPFALSALVLVGVLSHAAPASAATLSNPWGNIPTYVSVVRLKANNDHYVVWQDAATRTCAWSFLGNASGLNDNYLIVNGNGGGTMQVQDLTTFNGQPYSWCGWETLPPLYNGHFLDLYGGTGAETMTSGTGDTWLAGGAGNDWITSKNVAGSLSGGDGNDFLQSQAASGGIENLSGGNGNDCINDWRAGGTADCGSGTDEVMTDTPAKASGCEKIVPVYGAVCHNNLP